MGGADQALLMQTWQELERMNVTDKTRTIAAVRAIGPSALHVSWSDARPPISSWARSSMIAPSPLRDPASSPRSSWAIGA
jgi:hypothetical protein